MTADVRINIERLRQRLESLASVGRDPKGGMSRFPYTEPHAEACRLVAGWLSEAGLQPGLDWAGNLIGLGHDNGRPYLGVGSHLDTVPRGGSFDGALGVVAAAECAQALQDAGAILEHPLAAMAFAAEESGTFGIGCLTSRAVTGELTRDAAAVIVDTRARSLTERVSNWRVGLPGLVVPTLASYLELHIEQGAVLDTAGIDAGIVTQIVGISRTTVTFIGQANHGGTTPMHLRRDALMGASHLVLEIRRIVGEVSPNAVATAGELQVEPATVNVVPGFARLRVELRSPDESMLTRLRSEIETIIQQLAVAYRLEASVERWHHSSVAPLDTGIQEIIEQRAQARQLSVIRMPSWAGHDAKNFAPHVPTGMIFVPSKGGLSHCPEEFSDLEDIAKGAQLLLDALIQLDQFGLHLAHADVSVSADRSRNRKDTPQSGPSP